MKISRFKVRAILLNAITLCIVSTSAPSWAQPMPVKVNGHGGFPLTPAIASMWAAIDEGIQKCPQPLTFMIYFRGRDGWHSRKSTADVRLQEDPAVIQFDVGGIVLRAEYKKDAKILRLFGKEIDTELINVILVDKIDQLSQEEVRQLGRTDLCIPDGANPAVYVLEHSEAIRSVVLGN